MNAIFTIVAKNYLASALTLRNSVEKFQKNVDFFIVLSDEWESEEQEKKIEGNILIANSLGIPNFRQMAFMYDVVELATAIKPFVMLHLMNKMAYDKVIYFDPDIWIMHSIDKLWDDLEQYSCILTPHIVDMDVVSENRKESHILNRGIFNLGFIGVCKKDEICKFLAWWADRMQTECIRNDKLFVDQKWIDYLPVFCHQYKILDSKAYNIADWNLHERHIVMRDKEYCVVERSGERETISFFHFSGIKQQNPTKYFETINYKGDESEKAILAELILKYEKELLRNGYQSWKKAVYKYDYYDNGNKIYLLHRRLFRQMLLSHIDAGTEFETGNGSFYQYLNKKHLIDRNMKNENATESYEMQKKNKAQKGRSGEKRTVKLMIKSVRIFCMYKGARRYMDIINFIKYIADMDNQLFWFGDDEI